MIPFKFLSLLWFLAVSPIASAEGIDAPVLTRDEHFRPQITPQSLPDLVSSTHFEGRHFKILQGKSEAPLPLHPLQSLQLKAATVYFHLSKARRFWTEVLHSEFVQTLPPLSIRLDITNGFSDLAHYQTDSLEPQFNNALSIPGGTPFAGSRALPWNPEIWFRPVKRISPSELTRYSNGLTPDRSPFAQIAETLTGPLRVTQFSRMLQTALEAAFFPSSGADYPASWIRQGGTWVFAELILRGLRHLNPAILLEEYYLDAAMVPEIIYHEFSHIALSPHLKLNLSTPVVEGMADYFAARIGNHPVIAGGIDAYSRARPKNGNQTTAYQSALEENASANADFVLSILWMLHREFPETSDRIILEAARRLKGTRADIRHDLLRALLDGCTDHCQSPVRDRLKLRTLFEDRGF